MSVGMDVVRTDVFVVGTGPAGSTFARFLVPAGFRVVMADAGAQFSPRPGENLKNSFAYQRNVSNFTNIIQGLLHPISVPPNTGPLPTINPISMPTKPGSILGGLNPRQDPHKNLDCASASYAVGGMFLHWTGSIPRHHPRLERIQFIPPDEWDELYAAAEEVLNRRTDVYADSIRHTAIKEALAEHYGGGLRPPYGVQELPMAAERSKVNNELVRYTGTDTVLAPLIDEPGRYSGEQFAILPQHRVKTLIFKGDRVEYAVVEDLLNWRTIRVYADVFVVAAGTVMCAQLLWNSGIRPEALGRYLTEHPIAFCQVVLSRDLVKRMKGDARFRERIDRIEPLDPIPIPMNDPPPAVWIPVSEGRPWHCQINKDAFHYGLLPPNIDDRLIVDLRWFCSIDVNPSNRVVFEADINNQFGMPQPTFEFCYSEGDCRRMHEMMIDMVGAAHALGGFFPGVEPRFMPSGTCLHIQGTCRMGPADDGTSVVDPNSRVWGYRNLYVGGNCVIPTSNACNPTLTTVALATRAARSILAGR